MSFGVVLLLLMSSAALAVEEKADATDVNAPDAENLKFNLVELANSSESKLIKLKFESGKLEVILRRPENKCIGKDGAKAIEYTIGDCKMELLWQNAKVSLTEESTYTTKKDVTMTLTMTNATATGGKNPSTIENCKLSEATKTTFAVQKAGTPQTCSEIYIEFIGATLYTEPDVAAPADAKVETLPLPFPISWIIIGGVVVLVVLVVLAVICRKCCSKKQKKVDPMMKDVPYEDEERSDRLKPGQKGKNYKPYERPSNSVMGLSATNSPTDGQSTVDTQRTAAI